MNENKNYSATNNGEILLWSEPLTLPFPYARDSTRGTPMPITVNAAVMMAMPGIACHGISDLQL